MTLSIYTQLKEQTVLSVISSDNHNAVLQTLKELYKNGINSVRRLEATKTIQDLLKVLELRGLLSEDNVSPLKKMAREINSPDLWDKVNNYEETYVPREYVNQYAVSKENHPVTSGHLMNTSYPSMGMKNNTESIRKQRIYQALTERIGSSWKELGRELGIQECKIETIEYDYNTTMATKASIMLKQFDSTADPQRWQYVLMNALDKIRRKELKRKVEEILTMNIK